MSKWNIISNVRRLFSFQGTSQARVSSIVLHIFFMHLNIYRPNGHLSYFYILNNARCTIS